MTTQRPSRLKVAFIYYKRIVRWRRNSSPYLSCDAFADLSDYVYKPPRWRDKNTLSSPENAKIIFCRSDELQDFLDLYSGKLTAKVIITGNSDHEFHEIPKNIPKSVRALFLQNSYISDNNFVYTIPIGLENFRLGVNGNPKYIRYKRKSVGRPAKILFGPLSPTHPIRETVIAKFSQVNSNWDLLTQRLSPRNYARVSRKYGFIAAVRGNGVDTHRLWEALYRGLTPIVERDNWWRSLESMFPQVLSIDSWEKSEIEHLLSNRVPNDFDPRTLEALWMPHWQSLITKFVD